MQICHVSRCGLSLCVAATLLAGCSGANNTLPRSSVGAPLTGSPQQMPALPEPPPPGTYTVLYSFLGGRDDGASPSGLVRDQRGALYGTTSLGGIYHRHDCRDQTYPRYDGCGTVFKLTPSGSSGYAESIIYRFCPESGCADGRTPESSLVNDENGALYGTTLLGGAFGKGTVFVLTPSGSGYTERVLHSFGVSGDGAEPQAAVAFGKGGVLYGTTYIGGEYDQGTVFRLTPSGSSYAERILHSFGESGDGATPVAGVLSKDGAVYGTTVYGGTGYCAYPSGSGCGTVFTITAAGKEKVLYSFKGFNGNGDGAGPNGDVIFGKSGTLYGTTESGGVHGQGTVFKLTRSASGYSERILYSFGATSDDGAYPTAGVIFGKDGALLGTTLLGGIYNCGNPIEDGCGSVFKLTRSGSGYAERVLYRFEGGNDGGLPYAGLIPGKNGALYGTAETGGAAGYYDGTVFSLKP